MEKDKMLTWPVVGRPMNVTVLKDYFNGQRYKSIELTITLLWRHDETPLST